MPAAAPPALPWAHAASAARGEDAFAPAGGVGLGASSGVPTLVSMATAAAVRAVARARAEPDLRRLPDELAVAVLDAVVAGGSLTEATLGRFERAGGELVQKRLLRLGARRERVVARVREDGRQWLGDRPPWE